MNLCLSPGEDKKLLSFILLLFKNKKYGIKITF